jgi:hypothetical protein
MESAGHIRTPQRYRNDAWPASGAQPVLRARHPPAAELPELDEVGDFPL